MVAVFRLVVAGEPAFVVVAVVMSTMHVLSSVVAIAVARLAIFRIIVAVLIGVPGFIAMNLARFSRKLWRSLLFALRAFVATVARQLAHTTAAANNNKDDNARGGSPPWEEEEEHRFQ